MNKKQQLRLAAEGTLLPKAALPISPWADMAEHFLNVTEKAKAAGVDVTIDIDEDMFHIYPAFGGIFKNGQETTNRMVAFIEKHWS